MADIGLLPNTVPYTQPAPASQGFLGFANQAQELQSRVNQNKLFPLVQQQNQQAVQQGQLGIQKSQLDLNMAHNQNMMARFSALASNPNLSMNDLKESATDMVAEGLVTPQNAATELARASALPDQTPQTLRNHLIQSYLLPQMHAQQQMEAMGGSLVTTSLGGTTQFSTYSPLMGLRQIGSMPNTLTAAEKASRVPTVGPNNQPGSVPLSSTVTPTGDPLPQQSSLGTGRMAQQAGGMLGAPAVAAGGQPGFIPSAPPLGTESAANAAGHGSGEALAGAYQNAAGFQTRMYQLNQALSGLQGAGNTGPGTETRQQIVSFAQSLPLVGSAAKAVGISNPSEIANYDMANKYLTQYAMSQAGSLGQGTDEKLAVALTGNASTHISNLAAQDVVKANMALERMKQAGVMAFQQSGETPDKFNAFMAKWGNNADARAFALPEMEGKARQKLLTELAKEAPAQKRNFGQSYNAAVNAGLVPDLAGQ